MNLKERGITVGDLLLILIFVISTVFIINKFKDSDKQTYFETAPMEILTAQKILIIEKKENQFRYPYKNVLA